MSWRISHAFLILSLPRLWTNFAMSGSTDGRRGLYSLFVLSGVETVNKKGGERGRRPSQRGDGLLRAVIYLLTLSTLRLLSGYIMVPPSRSNFFLNLITVDDRLMLLGPPCLIVMLSAVETVYRRGSERKRKVSQRGDGLVVIYLPTISSLASTKQL